ncbi:MAG TPA: PQQ-binding-like beta-propeller repeat protein [Xanthobacteraceae bacterium]|jgi:alcohol dehydrogenase (cytochrome c)|nr:PQQ-binding-like beta-propeller repeat protein [Xanthobacteraceae bacterium]
MAQRNGSIRIVLLAGSILAAAAPALAAEVTPQRLLNPDKEPQNWLMNHRSYDGQRFSPLARINKSNVKNLRLAYAVPLGGSGGMEVIHATPLVEDGFLYITDGWGVLYKIDVTSGDVGRIVWRMEPKQEQQVTNRGAALWGNLVISAANSPARIIATDKTSGKAVWETNMVFDQSETRLTSAPLAIKDKIIVGAAGGDRGVRDWIAGLDAASGKVLWRKYVIPAPGEPGSETWKGNTNAWQTGGAAMWVTGTYDPDTNQTIWGTGNPVPMFDPFYRPGDNLYTNSAISWNPDTGAMNWYFQYTPGDMWDYDEVGTHILIDGQVAGQSRKLVTHSARNGFLYTMDRFNGQTVLAKPYMEVNWTKGIDQKTGKPLDYDPAKDIQTYAGVGNLTPGAPLKKVCPSQAGGNNYWPSSYSPLTKLMYIPALTACVNISIDREKHNAQRGWNGGLSQTDERFESNLTAIDPLTGEVKKSVHLRYPNYSGTLATAGGLVFLGLLDGTIAAYDDTTLDELWKVNVGTGFCAPPMTFEVNGKQYLAIASGLSTPARAKLVNTPELKEIRNATVLYVFAL